MNSDVEKVRLVVGRGRLGPTIRLFSDVKHAGIGDAERGWLVDPVKPKEFAQCRIELHPLLSSDHHDQERGASPALTKAFEGTKSRLMKKYDMHSVYSIAGVVVGEAFRGQGYGLLLFLKALELASEKNYWLTNDFKYSDTPAAMATWRALLPYTEKSYTGKHSVRQYDQGDKSGFRDFVAAYGLNAKGQKLMNSMLTKNAQEGAPMNISDQMLQLLDESIDESKFLHGTVRQWQNGRHMKNGTGWERIKTGRPHSYASKMPTVLDVVQGNAPPESLGPPIAAMPSLGVVGATAESIEEMTVSEALLALDAQLSGEESFDEDIMKMVFGVLRKVTGRKEPKVNKTITPSTHTPINMYKQLRAPRVRTAER